ncbi:MAG: hypothetical protein U0168_01540 [Nannocystaceae bacterium]
MSPKANALCSVARTPRPWPPKRAIELVWTTRATEARAACSSTMRVPSTLTACMREGSRSHRA